MDDMEVIYSYSRAQAIEDGILIDITIAANKAGIIYPTAVTTGLYSRYVSPGTVEAESEDLIHTRLMSVLYSLVTAIQESGSSHSSIHFTAPIILPNEQTDEARLWAAISGGDDGKSVITIMLEGED